MKKILYLFMAMLAVVACNGDEITTPSKKKGEIRPFELVRIEAAEGVKLRSSGEDGLLTALEIAKRGDAISGSVWSRYDTIVNNEIAHAWKHFDGSERGFGPSQRDTLSDHPALLMQSEDILSENGLETGWIKGYNFVILDKNNDTIAYLPNAILRKAEQDIYKAYADSNFTEIYRIFNEGFKFKPINGKMWRELKAQGKQ